MIWIVFKGQKNVEFDDVQYSYKNYDNAEVGDIVVANTRYGYAIAKVVKIDNEADDSRVNATIETVIKSMAEQRKEYERKELQKALVARVKRAKIEKVIETYLDAEDFNIVNDMTDKELEAFYNELKA